MRRKPWPYEAESCRQEAQALADENIRLHNQQQQARRSGNPAEADRIAEQIRGNNERIARLMVEAKK